MLGGRTEPRLPFADDLESQHLLTDEYQIFVVERNGHLAGAVLGAVASARRLAPHVALGRQPQVNAVDAGEVTQNELVAPPHQPHVTRREIRIFADDDVSFLPADVERLPERVARTVCA